ncbi:MAG: hypothetical protein ACTHMJ_08325 [Thermomicrobiales bacterium]
MTVRRLGQLLLWTMLLLFSTAPGAAGVAAAPQAEPAKPPITLADNGRTIDLAVGDRVLLQLGDAYIWAVQIADPAVLSRVVNVTVVKGAQGLYEAKQPGTTTLTAAGDPACRQVQPPCAQPSRLFRVQVRVSPAVPGLPNTGGGGETVGRANALTAPLTGALVALGLGLEIVRLRRRRRAPAR